MTAPQPNPTGATDEQPTGAGSDAGSDDASAVPTANPAYSTPPPEGISEADDS